MPDHVHIIFTPLINFEAMEACSLAEIMDAIKGASAHRINKALGSKGRVWQPELAKNWQDYPWLWKKAYVRPFAPSSECCLA